MNFDKNCGGTLAVVDYIVQIVSRVYKVLQYLRVVSRLSQIKEKFNSILFNIVHFINDVAKNQFCLFGLFINLHDKTGPHCKFWALFVLDFVYSRLSYIKSVQIYTSW